MPLLDSTRDEFTERNVPLHLLLGLVSLGRRLDGLLARRRPEVQDEGREHPLVYLILGLLSVRRTLLAELGPLLAAHRPRVPSPPQPPPPLRDLLR
jgi:hypothetical protein